MDFLSPIFTEKAECQDCYKCLRECSVKAIRVEGGHAAVVPELCVLCGHCVQVCPVGAKRVRNDLIRVQRLLALGVPVAVSLAPSWTAEFPGLDPLKLVAVLRRLGFSVVSETAIGADLVARRHAEDYQEAHKERGRKAGGIVISSACPTAVEYLKKYRPAISSRVTEMRSPLLAHAGMLKKELGPSSKVVFIGPCISKKREADLRPDLVDVAIDFSDLAAWIESAGLDPMTVAPGPGDAFYPERAAKGALFPIEGGMIASIRMYAPPESIRWMSFSGLAEIDRALAGLEAAGFETDDPEAKGEDIFLELLACPGGCINGPRCARGGGTIAKRLKVQDYATSAKAQGRTTDLDLRFRWDIAPVSVEEPRADLVMAALHKMGKRNLEDELNCGGCGYDTCRDFARAMIGGRAEAAMCLSYMRRLAQKKADGLIRAIPAGIVIVDRELRVVECNRAFASLLGADIEALWDTKPGLEGAELSCLVPSHKFFSKVLEGGEAIERDIRFEKRMLHGTIFGIERGAFAGGVFQDVTSPWIRKDRVVTRARKVMEQNLAVVQKIAFLLGENAAETESILSSIIESFDEEGDAGGAAG